MIDPSRGLYSFLLRPFLFLLPSEAAHRLAFFGLRVLMAVPGLRVVFRRLLLPRDPALRVRALGLDFPSPVLLAAGFDKDAVGFEALGALGFGGVEVGTLTFHPQPGNPRPRLFRLPADRALVNRMGFNNRGAMAAARSLSRPRETLTGVNIGKSKIAAETEAISDYVESARLLAPLADYLVINVSSPNTPGLRALQAAGKLEPLLAAVKAVLDEIASDRRPALLVKLAPDLSEEAIDEVADLCLRLGIDGIIATNTTIQRESLLSPASAIARAGDGGLSGAPLKRSALAVLHRLRTRVGNRLVLIACGGIESADDAWERIRAGASLVQIYTGFVYQGPLLPSRMARALLLRVREAGYQSIGEAVGSGA